MKLSVGTLPLSYANQAYLAAFLIEDMPCKTADNRADAFSDDLLRMI
ncbi:hypothetical protein NEISICOT_01815 [Neisseria sicca ATCC 29256]|uniref:Uncharacterized protein n=1 Tax=Neisseria sicca ATCC 29256 TaxID=547045 RepID=C6M5L6_NEISI|nr:hypothetical protein NEISICOT_01815 [Neisseria sicca ATCC 29256]